MILDIIILRFIHHIIALGTFIRIWLHKLRKPIDYKRRHSYRRLCFDSNSLKKIPLHVGLLISEDDYSYIDIANLIVWSMAIGIPYISVYDLHGELKRNKAQLELSIGQQKKDILFEHHCKYDVHIHCDTFNPNLEQYSGSSSVRIINVHLLSLDDGIHNLVNTAQRLCTQVAQHELHKDKINQSHVESLIQESSSLPDPDLLMYFGQVDSLLGYPPWQIRLSEILSMPTHVGIDYKSFLSAVVKYGNTSQRFGK